jgi:Na+-driven multidrug efflux pump
MNLLNMGIFWVDSIFIGRLGTDVFAAFGQTSMLLYTVTFAISGVGIAAGALVSRYIDRGDVECGM